MQVVTTFSVPCLMLHVVWSKYSKIAGILTLIAQITTKMKPFLGWERADLLALVFGV